MYYINELFDVFGGTKKFDKGGENIYAIEKHVPSNIIQHINGLNEEELVRMKGHLLDEIKRSEKDDKKDQNRLISLKKELYYINYRLEKDLTDGLLFEKELVEEESYADGGDIEELEKKRINLIEVSLPKALNEDTMKIEFAFKTGDGYVFNMISNSDYPVNRAAPKLQRAGMKVERTGEKGRRLLTIPNENFITLTKKATLEIGGIVNDDSYADGGDLGNEMFKQVVFKGENSPIYYVVGEINDNYIIVIDEKMDLWKKANPIERMEYYEDLADRNEVEDVPKTNEFGEGGNVEGKIFSIDDVEQFVQRLTTEIKAPYVRSYSSTLGGNENVNILLTIGLDDKSTWPNGILENSKYGKFHIKRDGTIELFSGSMYGLKKWRKSKAKSQDDLISRINKYISECEAVRNSNPNKMANGGNIDIDKVRLKYAKKDIALLKKEGFMSITGTEYGVINLELENGEYKIYNNQGQKLFDGDKNGAIEFVKNAYTVESYAHGGDISEYSELEDKIDTILHVYNSNKYIPKTFPDAFNKEVKKFRAEWEFIPDFSVGLDAMSVEDWAEQGVDDKEDYVSMLESDIEKLIGLSGKSYKELKDISNKSHENEMGSTLNIINEEN